MDDANTIITQLPPIDQLSPEEHQEILKALQALVQPTTPPPPPQYRVYYNEDGSIITYTTEDLPGNHLVITLDQYQQARHDAKVMGDKLVYTHIRNHVIKLAKTGNVEAHFCTSKYDISVVAQGDYGERQYYQVQANEITR